MQILTVLSRVRRASVVFLFTPSSSFMGVIANFLRENFAENVKRGGYFGGDLKWLVFSRLDSGLTIRTNCSKVMFSVINGRESLINDNSMRTKDSLVYQEKRLTGTTHFDNEGANPLNLSCAWPSPSKSRNPYSEKTITECHPPFFVSLASQTEFDQYFFLPNPRQFGRVVFQKDQPKTEEGVKD